LEKEIRGDVIETYKILNGNYNTNKNFSFNINEDGLTGYDGALGELVKR